MALLLHQTMQRLRDVDRKNAAEPGKHAAAFHKSRLERLHSHRRAYRTPVERARRTSKRRQQMRVELRRLRQRGRQQRYKRELGELIALILSVSLACVLLRPVAMAAGLAHGENRTDVTTITELRPSEKIC